MTEINLSTITFTRFDGIWQQAAADPAIDKVDIFKLEIHPFYKAIESIYQEVLTSGEIAKATRFRRTDDRKRFICGRYALRNLLALALEIPPQQIEISIGEIKKPAVDGIAFNLTHSGDYVLLAIAKIEIGIDLEYMDEQFDFRSLLKDSFNEQEINFIATSTDKAKAFYWLWTRKEALLKATGEGIVDDLHHITVLENSVKRLSKSYEFYSFKLDELHVACLAGPPSLALQFYSYG